MKIGLLLQKVEIMKKIATTKHDIKQLLLSQPIGIPVFHEIALRLQQMMNDHSYRIEEAIKLVYEDTALASEMLRYANTTYNSGKTPITTIKNAIVRLGSQQIVNLAFTASMASCKSDNPLINEYLRRLWRHSHTVAIASAWLAIQANHEGELLDINADEVYLAGLLHDIGKLYVLKSMDSLLSDGRVTIAHDLVNELLDELNIQQGIRVMRQWSIPEIYSDSVGRCETAGWKSGQNDHLAAALRLASGIHNYIERGIDVTETDEASELFNAELALLGINDVTYVYRFINEIS